MFGKNKDFLCGNVFGKNEDLCAGMFSEKTKIFCAGMFSEKTKICVRECFRNIWFAFIRAWKRASSCSSFVLSFVVSFVLCACRAIWPPAFLLIISRFFRLDGITWCYLINTVADCQFCCYCLKCRKYCWHFPLFVLFKRFRSGESRRQSTNRNDFSPLIWTEICMNVQCHGGLLSSTIDVFELFSHKVIHQWHHTCKPLISLEVKVKTTDIFCFLINRSLYSARLLLNQTPLFQTVADSFVLCRVVRGGGVDTLKQTPLNSVQWFSRHKINVGGCRWPCLHSSSGCAFNAWLIDYSWSSILQLNNCWSLVKTS